MQIKRNRPVAIKSYQQGCLTIDTVSVTNVSKIKRREDGRTIFYEVLYAEELKL